MNIFAPFARVEKAFAPQRLTPNTNVGIGFSPVMPTAALNFFGRGSYDNNYPNINRIAESMMTVLPYAVGPDGKPLAETPNVVKAILQPNSRMSVVRFLKSLVVLGLVYPYVPVLVWHYEGGKMVAGGKNAREDNIAGFTFLEGFECRRDGNNEIYYIDDTNGETYYDTDVLRISFDVNPYAITEGFSPTVASKKWTTLEDCLADYQVGHFKNGAKPGGIFVISAPTTDNFNDAVDEIEKKMRGAGKNNQTIYVHRHIDTATGQASTAEVEWVPTASNNNELALKDLFDQAERAKDMAFGVPAEIKGYLSNSNYSSVMMSERIFDKYVVLPKLTQLWSDFTHELNRITGGLGYALSFDYDIQSLSEDEKINAERKVADYNLFRQAVLDGNKPKAVCEALDLDASMAKLKVEAPEPLILPSAPTTEEKSAHFLDKALTQVEAETLEKMEAELLEALQADVDNYEDDTEEKRAERRAKLRAALLAIASARMEDAGTSSFVRAVAMARTAGYDLRATYELTQEIQEKYGKQLDEVVDNYSADNYRAIDNAVAEAETLELPVKETVMAVAVQQAWRAKRVADSEEHRAASMGQEDGFVFAQQKANEELGKQVLRYYKTWNTQSDPCPHCAELAGMRIPVEESFPGADNWGEYIAHLHPHCRCYLTFDAEIIQKSVKVDCPDCGLFLTEGTHAHLDKVKCNRCKKWFSVDINGGSSTAKEVQK